MIVLEDNDLVHLGAGQYQVFNAGPARPKSAAAAGAAGKGARPPTAVSRALQTLEMEVSQIMKARCTCDVYLVLFNLRQDKGRDAHGMLRWPGRCRRWRWECHRS